MFEVIQKHLSGNSVLEKVVICLIDQREYKAFQKILEKNKDSKE
jgi:hypothetical protein